jgi:ankyrin repeat protein
MIEFNKKLFEAFSGVVDESQFQPQIAKLIKTKYPDKEVPGLDKRIDKFVYSSPLNRDKKNTLLIAHEIIKKVPIPLLTGDIKDDEQQWEYWLNKQKAEIEHISDIMKSFDGYKSKQKEIEAIPEKSKFIKHLIELFNIHNPNLEQQLAIYRFIEMSGQHINDELQKLEILQWDRKIPYKPTHSLTHNGITYNSYKITNHKEGSDKCWRSDAQGRPIYCIASDQSENMVEMYGGYPYYMITYVKKGKVEDIVCPYLPNALENNYKQALRNRNNSDKINEKNFDLIIPIVHQSDSRIDKYIPDFTNNVEIINKYFDNSDGEYSNSMLAIIKKDYPNILVGTMSLIVAIERNSPDVIKYLIDKGVNPNEKDSLDKRYPLMVAIEYKHYESVECLLKNGANPKSANPKSEFYGDMSLSPLDMAIRKRDDRIIELLLKYGVEPTIGLYQYAVNEAGNRRDKNDTLPDFIKEIVYDYIRMHNTPDIVAYWSKHNNKYNSDKPELARKTIANHTTGYAYNYVKNQGKEGVPEDIIQLAQKYLQDVPDAKPFQEKLQEAFSGVELLDERVAPVILYHGTSSKFLPKILSYGLSANPKNKGFGSEIKGSSSQENMDSVGGVYFTNSAGTAVSAGNSTCRKYGGHLIIVIAEIVQKSAHADEDSIRNQLSECFDTTLRNHLGGYGYWYKRGMIDGDPEILKDILKDFSDAVHQKLSNDNDKHPIDYSLLKDYFDAKFNTKLYYTKDWNQSISDYLEGMMRSNSQAGNEFYATKYQEWKKNGIPIDSIESIDAKFKEVLDKLSRRYRTSTTDTSLGSSLRVTDDVDYNGRNKIIAIVEQVKMTLPNEHLANEYLKVVYGVVPEKFRKDYNDFNGALRLIDKNNNKLSEVFINKLEEAFRK